MKVYDAGTIRNVAIVGHSGCGKTQLIAAMLFAAGAVNRLGRVDDGTTVTDFDDEAIAAQALPGLEPRARRVAQDQDQPHRHPGHGQLPHRRALGAARGRGRRGGGGLGARRRGADREAVGRRGRRQPAADRGARPARSRTRQPGALARLAASRLRARDRADPAADRRGKELQGRGRPGTHARIHLCRQRQRRDDGRRHPGGHAGGGRSGADGAGGDGGRGRRGADGGVLRRGHAHPGAARNRAAQRHGRGEDLPAGVRVRHPGDRRSAAARRHRPLRALSARAPVCRDGQGRLRAGRHPCRQRAARRVRVEDDCRSRSPAASPCCGSSTALSSRTPPSTTSPATRRSGWATCWRCRARRRCTCRSCVPATWAPSPS